jgi:HupE / UreJ protein
MKIRLALAWVIAAVTASAHMISISTGEMRLDGAKLHYELRMPAYEVTAIGDYVAELLTRVEFPDAKRLTGTCEMRPAENAVVCTSDWEFPAAPKTVRIRSRLHQVTVANHVHLVSAVRNQVVDQAVLELSAPEAEIRFVPQSAAEAAYQQFSSGVRRAVAGPPQLLFLVALILATRNRREFFVLMLASTVGQAAATLSRLSVAPQFVEAAAALAVAYLAMEILFLSEAQHRWAVVAVLGALQGLAYAALVSATGFSPFWVLLGAFSAIVVLLAIGGVVWSKLPWRPVRPLAFATLAISLGWFLWRVMLA